jgi:VWFA-related protein
VAKRSETSIYAIALRGVDTQTKGFREAEHVMKTLAYETGGRSFFPAKIEDLAGVYTQISDELSSQYTIGYVSKNQRRDGGLRRLVVRVNRPGLTARTRQSYYAPTGR